MKCLVIMVNRCQPAYLGCYGNDWFPTPTLDRLAAEGVVFDHHFAEYPSPRGARRSWHSGRYSIARTGSPELLSFLWEHEITTALIADERSPSFRSRFWKGWESQQWIRRQHLGDLKQETLLGGTVQAAIDWLDLNAARDNWLLWLELSSLQLPWDQNEHDEEATQGTEEEEIEPWFDALQGHVGREFSAEDVERLQPTYAGMVSAVDQWLGQLVDFLKQKGLYDDLLLVLTSDCGLPLGEHGVVGDARPWLHEELVHLPLLIHLPGNVEAGRHVQQLSQAVDLMPTLVEAFELPVPEGIHGKSLLPLAKGQAPRLREYACSRLANANEEEWSIRTHQWYLILPMRSDDSSSRKPTLYIKPEDRWEVNDVHAQHPEVAERLELALRRFMLAARGERLDDLPELRDNLF